MRDTTSQNPKTGISKKATEKLRQIMIHDYSVEISDDQAQEFGMSLLRLTRIAITAFARAEEKNSSVQARDKQFLESKTSE